MLAPPTTAVTARAPTAKRWHIVGAGPCRRSLKRGTLVTVQHFGMPAVSALLGGLRGRVRRSNGIRQESRQSPPSLSGR
jgi:hypothetical protein